MDLYKIYNIKQLMFTHRQLKDKDSCELQEALYEQSKINELQVHYQRSSSLEQALKDFVRREYTSDRLEDSYTHWFIIEHKNYYSLHGVWATLEVKVLD